jgi:outer membrane immunogenic protein
MTSSTFRAAIAAAILIAPLGAHAADLGGRMPHPTYYAPAPASTNWTGFYAGINGGYGFGKSEWDPLVVSTNPSPKGFLASRSATIIKAGRGSGASRAISTSPT